MLGVSGSLPDGPAFVPAIVASRLYTEQGILTESPNQLVLTVFEFILSDCRKGNSEKVRKWFKELSNSLDYNYEQAFRLQTLYESCLALLEQGQLDEVRSVMTDVRDAWVKAFKLDTPFSPAPADAVGIEISA
ncbi:MAG: hypothetical protein QF473_00495 [Planctomycetota bacterium]|jgi:hypothetical protein|nr:hypothetical protein [Planctomycetota bacterium]